MGRTNKLVDGCYSFWQAGAFPLLAALLKHQQGLRQGTTAGKERAPTAAAAARVAALRLGASGKAAADAGDGGGSSGDGSSSEGGEGDTLTEFVADLPTLNPLEAAQRRRAELQRQLDSAVEASIDAEDRYRAAAGVAAGGPLQQGHAHTSILLEGATAWRCLQSGTALRAEHQSGSTQKKRGAGRSRHTASLCRRAHDPPHLSQQRGGG